VALVDKLQIKKERHKKALYGLEIRNRALQSIRNHQADRVTNTTQNLKTVEHRKVFRGFESLSLRHRAPKGRYGGGRGLMYRWEGRVGYGIAEYLHQLQP
jgi:hypothetical protein